MGVFRVLFYMEGILQLGEPVEIRATSPQDAVERLLGFRVSASGKLGKLCAQAWEAGKRPPFQRHFFVA